jgi:hypothetical protein
MFCLFWKNKILLYPDCEEYNFTKVTWHFTHLPIKVITRALKVSHWEAAAGKQQAASQCKRQELSLRAAKRYRCAQPNNIVSITIASLFTNCIVKNISNWSHLNGRHLKTTSNPSTKIWISHYGPSSNTLKKFHWDSLKDKKICLFQQFYFLNNNADPAVKIFSFRKFR